MKSYPIVGGFYRPPANALLKFMPQGTPLILRPEPENPYDPNAIQVLVRGAAISFDNELDEVLLGYGTDIAAVRDTFEIHLGYIPRGFAATMTLSGEISGTFGFDAKGKPLVRIEED